MCKLPSAALGRIWVIFIALAVVKLVLLVTSGKHLHEIHWRVGGFPSEWSCFAVFFAALGIAMWSLVEVGKQCQPAGLGAIRAANATVLVLGLLFIFLTFHEGDKNYLYPVMTGTLKWHNLIPYLSLNLFFRPPYLAAWLAGYALLYYVCVRLNRERSVLYLTAVFAGAYGLLCLRELARYRNELAVASCFGVAAVLCLRRSDYRLKSAWLLVPLVWTLLALGIFYTESRMLRRLNPYFSLIAGTSAVLFAGTMLLAAVRGYQRMWIKVLPFYFVAFFLLTSVNYPMSENYNNLLCYALQLPHYFADELVLSGLLALGAAAYSRLRPRAGLLWLDFLGLALVVIALIDVQLSRVMGVRLGWDLLSFGHSPAMMWRMAQPYLPGLVLILFVTVVGYALLQRAARSVLDRARVPSGAKNHNHGAGYVTVCFLLLGVSGLLFVNPDNVKGQAALRLVQTSPWWKLAAPRTLGYEELASSAISLGLGDFRKSRPVTPTEPRRNLNVVLVFMESSYNKHLSLFSGGEDTQPLLAGYKDRMEVFPNFFANFAGSIHARFAAFTSLYPIKDYNAFTLNRVGVKSIFEVLHDNDYACSMFYSSYFDYTGFRDFLKHRGLAEMFDADTMPGERATKRVAWGLREEETLGAIKRQIQKQAAKDEKFFLTYVPAAPHYPYDSIPDRFNKYKLGEFKNYTPLYLNELLYMDWVLASILDQLKESGLLDKTLVIITADHGEMLGGKDGSIGHGWAVTPELANVPLIIMDPDKPKYRVNTTVGSHVDLLPTILDALRIAVPTTELYQGRSLYAQTQGKDERLIYLNSYRQYGVLSGSRLFLGDRVTEKDGGDSNLKAFSISNVGSKTIFLEDTTATNLAISISRFDELQQQVLRNYSSYRDELVKNAPATQAQR